MNRWIVRAYEPWDSHRTHNGRTEERKSEDGKWYKADEVDARIKELEEENKTLREAIDKLADLEMRERELRKIIGET